MDGKTLQFYAEHASPVAARYAAAESAAAGYFHEVFGTAGRILDVGCGSGRDLQALVEAGFEAEGVDACEALLAEAKRRYPALASRLRRDSLPDLGTVPDASFDGILCWAVLMHLPVDRLFDTLFNLRRVLRAGGRLLISTPLQGPRVDAETHRDPDGRLFNEVPPEQFHFLFEKVGFRRTHRWDSGDTLGRSERTWATQAFVLEGPGSRSLETIEAILNRDKKDATYKPALVRALAELATTSHHSATWLPGGRVAVPLRLIADKWIEYYWPLIESLEFIPQKRGEKPGCAKPMKFRAPLARLVEHYRNRGGLPGFTVDYRSRGLSEEAAKVHGQALSKVRDAIREGPVYFAGGGGSGTFRYDSASGRVEMAADLWRELSLMGTWIADATVLRWAELTTEISQGLLKPSQVIDALLTVPLAERDVHAARTTYEDLPDKVCVWTGVPLGGPFELDHAIPFALWRNNDLWNLLPASKAANQDKRDRLPSRSLLSSRRSCIVDYWSRMRDVHAERFEFEAERLAGRSALRSTDWEGRLFRAVAEAVEHTGIQRGVERWEPRGFRTMESGWTAEGESAPEARTPSGSDGGPVLVADPPIEERFIRWVPFYDLTAAAGAFGPEQSAPDPGAASAWAWVGNSRVTKDMFALRVVGRSMQPRIPDGAICLFRAGEVLAGTRQGRIVLVALRDSVDPETAGRLTVKQYWSEKRFDEEGRSQHVRIELRPLNPDFTPIVITQAEEDSLRVLGEWVGVIPQS